nr:hypothetical protein [Actinomyces sp.]
MKTFVPGQIASAKDVNDNFAELAALTRPVEKTLRIEPKWAAYGGSVRLLSIGALHTVSLTVRWTPSAFNARLGEHFPICYLPDDVPAPADWYALGTIHAGAYATPLVYRADTRSIRAFPTASFSWDTNWCYGTATWIK